MGKIGVQTKRESMTALINNWVQTNNYFSIDLSSSFFGLGSSRLQGTSEFITLFEAGEEPISSDQPDELLESALGIPLPITYLPYWIKALPVPDQAFVIEYNEQGLPATLVQYNWHLRFSNYAIHQNATHQNLPLPGKITLEQADSRIILAIKKWTLPSP